MLSTLHIRNFAIIEELEIEFCPGLNILTGETGAGKSVILGALQLLLGHRADKTLLRAGTDGSEIAGIFQFKDNKSLLKKVNSILQESGVPNCEEGQLLITRKLQMNSNKSYVNSTPVTLNLLVRLGQLLVDVHGPYDHQLLIHSKTQLELLDAFADLTPHLEKCHQYFKELRQIRQEIKNFNANKMTPESADIMRFHLNEIRQAALKEGEDDELSTRHASAANRHEILEIINRSIQNLNADTGLLNQLAIIMRDLSRLQRLDDLEGPRFIQSFETIYDQINEFQEGLNDYAQKIDLDPAAFNEMEERLGLIQRLKQKYGDSIKAVLKHAEKIEEKLSQAENRDHYLQQLNEKENDAKSAFITQASLLSAERCKHAERLNKLITKKLQYLGFKDCSFNIKLTEASISPTGIDSVDFSFSPNPGEGNKSLREIASAGEISRVMLAIKTILAGVDQTPVLVFDEIDVNIGGVVAGKVGIELAKLSKEHQVLCITHLPQVAAKGDRHFLIDKSISNERTKAILTLLTGKSRVQEIARMLGGRESTSVVLKHATELIENVPD